MKRRAQNSALIKWIIIVGLQLQDSLSVLAMIADLPRGSASSSSCRLYASPVIAVYSWHMIQHSVAQVRRSRFIEVRAQRQREIKTLLMRERDQRSSQPRLQLSWLACIPHSSRPEFSYNDSSHRFQPFGPGRILLAVPGIIVTQLSPRMSRRINGKRNV